jgi:hypothetical protein
MTAQSGSRVTTTVAAGIEFALLESSLISSAPGSISMRSIPGQHDSIESGARPRRPCGNPKKS